MFTLNPQSTATIASILVDRPSLLLYSYLDDNRSVSFEFQRGDVRRIFVKLENADGAITRFFESEDVARGQTQVVEHQRLLRQMTLHRLERREVKGKNVRRGRV